MLSRIMHFRIGDGMIAVVAVALVCAWPWILIPAGIALLTFVAHRLGWTLIELLVVISILGILIGLCLPPVQTRCYRRLRVVAPAASLADPLDDEEFEFLFGQQED